MVSGKELLFLRQMGC